MIGRRLGQPEFDNGHENDKNKDELRLSTTYVTNLVKNELLFFASRKYIVSGRQPQRSR